MGKTRKAQKPTRYQIHDNGGRPFFVEIAGSKVTVLKNMNTGTWDNKGMYKEIEVSPKMLFEITAKQVFIGKRSKAGGYDGLPPSKAIGNSILLKVGAGKYMFIGHEIFEFQTVDGEEIKEYYSDIGNSDVPYPYAIGSNSIYIMLDKVSVDKSYFDLKQNIYDQYYKKERLEMCLKGNPKTDLCKDRAAAKDEIQKAACLRKPLKAKVLVKRSW